MISSLGNVGLDSKNMMGQSHDVASVMKEAFKGVKVLIKKTTRKLYNMPTAVHTL